MLLFVQLLQLVCVLAFLTVICTTLAVSLYVCFSMLLFVQPLQLVCLLFNVYCTTLTVSLYVCFSMLLVCVFFHAVSCTTQSHLACEFAFPICTTVHLVCVYFSILLFVQLLYLVLMFAFLYYYF